MNWQELAASSHYQTAVAIGEQLSRGNVAEAVVGIEELIEAVGRSERRALRSQLIRLMVHVLKWIHQPERRSSSWEVTILQARDEIAAIQEEVPSLKRDVLEGMWDACLQSAIRQAEAETGQAIEATSLTWDQVFNDDYRRKTDNGDAAPQV